ncbi:MAG: alanine racemase [Clostridia bacterium]|nr:alanine racemase [Clostridia bacterium]
MKIDVTIDLGVIKRNIATYTGNVILMVKADAYGHGLTEVARAVDHLVYGYGVATIEEGVALRECTNKEIFVFQWAKSEVPSALHSNLTLSVTDFGSLDYVKDKGVRGVLKVNTGMNRFGFDVEDAPLLKAKLQGVDVRGSCSHVYSGESLPAQQMLFDKWCAQLGGEDDHLLSSCYNHLPHNLIRVGIGAYEGAMTVTSRVVAVRRLKRGDNVGYGNTLSKDGNVAWIFGGYADGINRDNPQPVMIGNKLCNVVAVCMDSTAVFTGEYSPEIDEEAHLVGQHLTAKQIAEVTHTVPYVVMTSWRGRVKRTYICSSKRHEKSQGQGLPK